MLVKRTYTLPVREKGMEKKFLVMETDENILYFVEYGKMLIRATRVDLTTYTDIEGLSTPRAIARQPIFTQQALLSEVEAKRKWMISDPKDSIPLADGKVVIPRIVINRRSSGDLTAMVRVQDVDATLKDTSWSNFMPDGWEGETIQKNHILGISTWVSTDWLEELVKHIKYGHPNRLIHILLDKMRKVQVDSYEIMADIREIKEHYFTLGFKISTHKHTSASWKTTAWEMRSDGTEEVYNGYGNDEYQSILKAKKYIDNRSK